MYDVVVTVTVVVVVVVGVVEATAGLTVLLVVVVVVVVLIISNTHNYLAKELNACVILLKRIQFYERVLSEDITNEYITIEDEISNLALTRRYSVSIH